VLKHELTLPPWANSRLDSFETLVTTILSQNTTDRNTARALESLSKRFEITPEALAKAELSQIEETIKIAGLHRSKSKAIRQAAKLIIEKHHGKMEPLLSLPIKDARKALIQFDGDGPKTADVVLLFSTNKPTIPVDTHEDRVAKRLGFAPANGNYELVRQNLQTLYDTRDYLSVHLLLIEHGRKYCKARHPLCNKCPIKLYCPLRESGTS